MGPIYKGRLRLWAQSKNNGCVYGPNLKGRLRLWEQSENGGSVYGPNLKSSGDMGSVEVWVAIWGPGVGGRA